jgi:hypothetical protein
MVLRYTYYMEGLKCLISVDGTKGGFALELCVKSLEER